MNRVNVFGALLLGITANVWASGGTIRIVGSIVEPPCNAQVTGSQPASFQLTGCAIAPRVTVADPANPRAPVRVTITDLNGQPVDDMDDGMHVRVHGQAPKKLLVRLDYQ